MTSKAETAERSPLHKAADNLLEACTIATCVRVAREPIDALARGVVGVAKVYDKAAASVPKRRESR